MGDKRMMEWNRWDFFYKAVMIGCICLTMGIIYSVVNFEHREKKCIEGELYWLTDQGYWQATNYNSKRCKVLPLEEKSNE